MFGRIRFPRIMGNTIKYCQCIEYDIKMIYSATREGDFDKNFKALSGETMGGVIAKLQALDNSDRNPYFSREDYKLLKEIMRIRNYWVHEGYANYVYGKAKFSTQYRALKTDSKRLKKLHKQTAKTRKKFVKSILKGHRNKY